MLVVDEQYMESVTAVGILFVSSFYKFCENSVLLRNLLLGSVHFMLPINLITQNINCNYMVTMS